MFMDRILIIGAGDLGQQIAHWMISDHLNVIGFVDDWINKGTNIYGIKVLGKISDIEYLYSESIFDKLIIGIGYSHFDFREAIFNKFHGIIPFATYIHSSCFVDTTAVIAEGCVIYPNCFIDQNVIINENVLINICSILGHGCNIGSHSFVAAKVLIGGNANIGKKCMIGNGTTTLNGIKIIDRCVIGCGAVVLKSINKRGVYLGNPAKYFSMVFE